MLINFIKRILNFAKWVDLSRYEQLISHFKLVVPLAHETWTQISTVFEASFALIGFLWPYRDDEFWVQAVFCSKNVFYQEYLKLAYLKHQSWLMPEILRFLAENVSIFLPIIWLYKKHKSSSRFPLLINTTWFGIKIFGSFRFLGFWCCTSIFKFLQRLMLWLIKVMMNCFQFES